MRYYSVCCLLSSAMLVAQVQGKGSGGRGGGFGGRSHGGRGSLGARGGSLYGRHGVFGRSHSSDAGTRSRQPSSTRTRVRTGLAAGAAGAAGVAASRVLMPELLRPRSRGPKSPWSSWSEPPLAQAQVAAQPHQWTSWSPTTASDGEQPQIRNPAVTAAQQRSSLDFRQPSTQRDEKTRSILRLVTLSYTGSRVLRKVEERNSKVYLNKFRRWYWLGDRYFHNDPLAMRGSRTTCSFPVGPADNLTYTDDQPIHQILFQCHKFYKDCCGLDCCQAAGASGPYSAGTGFSAAAPRLRASPLMLLSSALTILFSVLLAAAPGTP